MGQNLYCLRVCFSGRGCAGLKELAGQRLSLCGGLSPAWAQIGSRKSHQHQDEVGGSSTQYPAPSSHFPIPLPKSSWQMSYFILPFWLLCNIAPAACICLVNFRGYWTQPTGAAGIKSRILWTADTGAGAHRWPFKWSAGGPQRRPAGAAAQGHLLRPLNQRRVLLRRGWCPVASHLIPFHRIP